MTIAFLLEVHLAASLFLLATMPAGPRGSKNPAVAPAVRGEVGRGKERRNRSESHCARGRQGGRRNDGHCARGRQGGRRNDGGLHGGEVDNGKKSRHRFESCCASGRRHGGGGEAKINKEFRSTVAERSGKKVPAVGGEAKKETPQTKKAPMKDDKTQEKRQKVIASDTRQSSASSRHKEKTMKHGKTQEKSMKMMDRSASDRFSDRQHGSASSTKKNYAVVGRAKASGSKRSDPAVGRATASGHKRSAPAVGRATDSVSKRSAPAIGSTTASSSKRSAPAIGRSTTTDSGKRSAPAPAVGGAADPGSKRSDPVVACSGSIRGAPVDDDLYTYTSYSGDEHSRESTPEPSDSEACSERHRRERRKSPSRRRSPLRRQREQLRRREPDLSPPRRQQVKLIPAPGCSHSDRLAVGSRPTFPGGFWFGINYQMDIEGEEIRGRFFRAMEALQRYGEQLNPLPKIFHESERECRHRQPAVGGRGKGKGAMSWAAPAWTRRVWTPREKRVAAVMWFVSKHKGEYRQWNRQRWGSGGSEAEGTTEEWRKVGSLDPDHSLITHRQLQLHPAGPAAVAAPVHGSTIVRRSVGQPLAAPSYEVSYEARNVFITSLPEVLLRNLYECPVAEVYEEYLESEVIIGKMPNA